jgi:DNA-binding GntR family transcriptional regulator
MILDGELPPQTRLVEIQLAEQFEVSRTPVREALKRLAAEQLVLSDAVRGLIVRAPEPHEIEDVYRVRDALDALAVRLAAVRITPRRSSTCAWCSARWPRRSTTSAPTWSSTPTSPSTT